MTLEKRRYYILYFIALSTYIINANRLIITDLIIFRIAKILDSFLVKLRNYTIKLIIKFLLNYFNTSHVLTIFDG